MRFLIRVIIMVLLVGGVTLFLVPPGQSSMLDRLRDQLTSQFAAPDQNSDSNYQPAPPRTVYRWVDEDGVVHYSDQKSNDVSQETIELKDNLGRLPEVESASDEDAGRSDNSGQGTVAEYPSLLQESLEKARALQQQVNERYDQQRELLNEN
ncbi:DUF4124 domain-containing protein [Aestuariirhabdus sp. Z084]|uniref:DUF4124 domain-containing protein n=1 Tax=Aestuariirhabdus haliotis TaxID=2918751 RepID=UPI00201B3A3A|nr:DUF4124 domain-containing protein [Aestuariirhabdus haliotis]MCL6416530.1 DUF4124 domain-containing protein [Aestuariirhabdus haliotis]MCL6420520.1 DUF4124 domain-containing protein [Aestuariirhabdus haliotis]